MAVSGTGRFGRVMLVASTAVVAGLFFGPPAAGGPVSDFERALAATYAPYRAALMQTNQKDRAASESSISAFESRWRDLMRTYRAAPPPQYADDDRWPATISAIEETIASAKTHAGGGDLARAHDVLERVRDELGKLRSRNGVVVFSDRMDAYHEHMEHVLTLKLPADPVARMGLLREEAAVLVHLAGLVKANAPVALAKDAEFGQALSALTGSADGLLAAVRNADPEATEKAMKALKPAYARMFVRYG